MMWDIGFMVWRIGEILDFDAQVGWLQQAGFEAISFHASPGVPGQWRGVDPAVAGRGERRRLRDRLATFSTCEIHAPFEAVLSFQEPLTTVERLAPIIGFAGDIGASVVTVHPGVPDDTVRWHSTPWLATLEKLDEMAGQAGVVIGVETLKGYDGFVWLREAGLSHLRVTLDVGHTYLDDGVAYRPYGTIGGLVRSLGSRLVHMHVHDYDGTRDHVEVESGRVDFDDLLRGAAEVGYTGAMCLELNPDHVTPAGMLLSRDLLRQKMVELDPR